MSSSTAKVTFVHGDITQQQVDAIVNAANSSLLGGGGVDGAIHWAGGPEILAACRRLRETEYPKGLPAGGAVATTAGQLPARHVIHVVGPVYSTRADRSTLLRSCYVEAIRVAAALEARTIAFPAVSTGAFAWPLADAARIAVGAVVETPSSLEEVRFVLFTRAALRAFESAYSLSRARPRTQTGE
ncbi:O-acetyl-ADP-ribose deacetylase [Pseudofrankia saprophytica]|uniref:O-acetyl-ADP-ribose deacetylase n=1 Tax=Pseudofrankia saprophytica TaxID=298655 RepID=UPI000234B734|nr:O-acetyl-ADP-ribose deacetylase [Pseudofrankia saprophytica]